VTAASDAMADRLRPVLAKKKLALVEKPMFGGLGFMLNGNMLIGTTAKGALLVRIDPDKADEAQQRGAELMHMGPRVMTGFMAVQPGALPDAASIRAWIDYCHTYVRTLPAK
jgi:TfoX/Sxy family transcriptional regulator of competence genes